MICAVAWIAALSLGFVNLIELDVAIYGMSLVLEFVALIALRIREPNLPRPFRVPGGMAGAILVAIGPAALVGRAIIDSFHQLKTPGRALSKELRRIATVDFPRLVCHNSLLNFYSHIPPLCWVVASHHERDSS